MDIVYSTFLKNRSPPSADDILLAYLQEITQPSQRSRKKSDGRRRKRRLDDPDTNESTTNDTDADFSGTQEKTLSITTKAAASSTEDGAQWAGLLQQLVSAQEELRVVADVMHAVESTQEKPSQPQAEKTKQQQQQQQQAGVATTSTGPTADAAPPALPFEIGLTAVSKMKLPPIEAVNDAATRLASKQRLLEVSKN